MTNPNFFRVSKPLPIEERERLASALVRNGAHVALSKAGPIQRELSWETIVKAICGHPIKPSTSRKIAAFVETLEGKAA